ncbi:Serine/threonine-protein phosphatase PGAM5, mitochondrial-like [Oopsacas minuta]|uniref:Serine/threonine-protein phosphatase PGAM5, mitochondrial n=1 Tax=Oopsacas minuta TaxID=111878 RepID=A0AAV7JT48_9METZ|nr:Serine/threonine-protein phosphatase PGAM5, mitochondrial-like [Oopsacas minuta]
MQQATAIDEFTLLAISVTSYISCIMHSRVFVAAVSLVTPSAICYVYSREDMPGADTVRRLFGRISVLCSNGIGTGEDSTIVDTSFYTKYITWDDNWDRREPVSGKERDSKESGPPDSSGADAFDKKNERVEKPTATRNLILIRHGQYDLSGSEDAHKTLTELGKLQAKQTGLRLKEMGVIFEKIIYSTMTRATETAKIISLSSPDIPIQSCEMLREGAPYRPDPTLRHWKPTNRQFFQDGARTEAAFRKYFYRASPDQKENTTEVLVCHANVIRYFVCRALQLPPEAWLRMSVGNCSLTFITIRPNGRVSLRGMGDTGHLPHDNVTFN